MMLEKADHGQLFKYEKYGYISVKLRRTTWEFNSSVMCHVPFCGKPELGTCINYLDGLWS